MGCGARHKMAVEPMVEKQEVETLDRPVNLAESLAAELLPAFQRLDARLGVAIRVAETIYGSSALDDRFRGLYVHPQEAREAVGKEPGQPTLSGGQAELERLLPSGALPGSRLEWLAASCGLSTFDLDLLLLALAPEIDRRYERIYAFLQDHVARRRPTVDLALSLLCRDAADRLERRAHFDPEAPLIRYGILQLVPESSSADSLLAQSLQLDQGITRFLLNQEGLDPRLVGFCQLVEGSPRAAEIPLLPDAGQRLIAQVSNAWEHGRPLRLYFHGPSGSGKTRTAAALAGYLGVPLLVVDLAQILNSDSAFIAAVRQALLFVWFYDTLLCLNNLDALRADGSATRLSTLLDLLAEDGGIAILTGAQPWSPTPDRPLGLLSVPFPPLDTAARREFWQSALAIRGSLLSSEDLDAVSTCFRLRPAQIEEAAAVAAASAPSNAAGSPVLSREAVFAAARAQSEMDAGALAHKVPALYTWADIVLPEDSLAQLREICSRVAHAGLVLGEWGFDRKLSLGKGVSALFSGPSGTGKTMAAEIIANELGLDLYRIDLAGVVSKYIGETEKNLDRVFSAAEDTNAILFFDEADALFGKRSEVRDSHDRYANIEISYLLQKMEAYQGLAILATNLRQNLDEAFLRRLAFTIHFPFPDEASRLRIWQGIWPEATPRAAALDLSGVARRFKLSGGQIKNAALAAAFQAAGSGGTVTQAHLLHAVRREFQKLGKSLSEAELGVENDTGHQTGGKL
jgi:AAA+ superfamily predicted ATPase